MQENPEVGNRIEKYSPISRGAHFKEVTYEPWCPFSKDRARPPRRSHDANEDTELMRHNTVLLR